MTDITVAEKNIKMDDQGFPVNQEAWNHEVSRAIAKQLGIEELDGEQLEVIEFLRKYYKKFNAFPFSNYVCKHVE